MYQGTLSFSGSRDHYGRPRPHDPQEVNIVRAFEAATIAELYDRMVAESQELEMDINLFFIGHEQNLDKIEGMYVFSAGYPDLLDKSQEYLDGFGTRIEKTGHLHSLVVDTRHKMIRKFFKNLQNYKNGDFRHLVDTERMNTWDVEKLFTGADVEHLVSEIGEDEFDALIAFSRRK